MSHQKNFFLFCVLYLGIQFQLLAQLDTIFTYHSLTSCTYLSSSEYPQQLSRILPDRPGTIKQLTLHLDGGNGSCQLHLLGHEGGLNFPTFGKELHPPMEVIKSKEGPVSVELPLSNEIFVENDQFYIALTDFVGDFGLQQDSTFEQIYCISKDGGKYYPTILYSQDSSKWIGNKGTTALDVVIDYLPSQPPIFSDITQSAGIPLHLSNHSIAWGDIDQDGWLDVLIGGHLYKNQQGTFVNISKQLAALNYGNVSGTTFIDMDNDGDQDILLFGRTTSSIYLNSGQGKFTKKELQLPPLPSLHAYSIADINKDNFPDIVVAQLWGEYPLPLPNYLFLNNKKLGFKNVTKRLYPTHRGTHNFPKGITCTPNEKSTYLPNKNKNRRSRGTQFTDFDLDGDADLYITNYFLEEDEFYRNKGNGKFKKIKAPKHYLQSDTMANHGTGVDWYDFDNDGDFDLLLPQLAHPRYMIPHDHRGTTLFRNDNGQFTDLKNSHGIHFEETHAGAAFGDVNNDGLVDLITTVYYGCRYVDLYLQQPDHTFQLSTYLSGFPKLTTGFDACFVDYNNDGLLDLAMGDKGHFRLFKNVSTRTNNWIKINLQSTSQNSAGIGIIVKVFAGKEVYTQEVIAGRGQRMQKPATLHFGIGSATTIDKVEVYWNHRKPTIYKLGNINQSYTLAR